MFSCILCRVLELRETIPVDALKRYVLCLGYFLFPPTYIGGNRWGAACFYQIYKQKYYNIRYYPPHTPHTPHPLYTRGREVV